ncbi:MAG: dTDP-4-dehydrorhamnose reductase, partial [Pontimonas sp.]|nr:dTDP-4-dehydrorhamnose reductase [Pontimonas sp.]
MLGQALVRELSDFSVSSGTRETADLTRPETLEAFITPGSIVINAAAYTQVDAAEEERDAAFATNATGVANLASVAKAKNARVIHVSTDYVFDGAASAPYGEESPTNPATVYGESKRAGENLLREILPDGSVIVRTAWLYGVPGSSFPATIMGAAKTRDTLQVVTDQIGQPTWTRDVARMIRSLLESSVTSGVFHATNAGQASWWEFARRLFELAGWDPERVLPTTSETFVRPAPRPAWSVLGHDNWEKNGLPAPRHWREALDDAWDTELHTLVSENSR